jgi:hypothetical protein
MLTETIFASYETQRFINIFEYKKEKYRKKRNKNKTRDKQNKTRDCKNEEERMPYTMRTDKKKDRKT